MLRRLFLVFLPSLTTSVSIANTASWNCQQNKDSYEWICVGDTKPAEYGLSKEPEPVSSRPVELTSPAKAEPVQVLPPVVPEPVESIQPSLAAPPKPVSVESEPVSEQAKQSAPPCDVKSSNCQPVKSAPKAQIEPVAVDEHMINILDPVFDHKQEQIFGALTNRLQSNPWGSCDVEPGTQQGLVISKDTRNTSPLDVKSNYSEIFDNEIGSYYGNVEMNRADQRSSSNTANYDSVSQTLDLHGDVYYSDEEFALHSDTATLKLATDQAKLRDTLFIYSAARTPLRGNAGVAYRDSKFLSHYKDVTYTSCRPGNQDWAIHASELKLNKMTGRGAAKNAWVEFKGVPVFYSPYFAFPVDNRRLSGFLAPSYNYTQISGMGVTVPYYWNIAPNYDATMAPRYLTERGILLGGEFRYLTEQSRGIARAEYLPHDNKLNKGRYLGSLKNTTLFTPKISSNLDLNYVSDKNYFAELGNALNYPNFSFIKSYGDVKYASQDISFATRLISYQSVDPTLTGSQLPYKRLPQINLNLTHAFDSMPIDVALQNESVYFQHNDRVEGQRLNIKPSVSFPLHTASSYLTPKVSLQYTQYFLNNQAAGQPEDISRTLPIVSLDSGVFLERDINIANTSMLHTLEPRLFYLYIPETNQSDIPLFDSALYDFWYSSMFRENRFSGSDRVQDANQITAALSTRLVDPVNGLERLKLSIGEIIYFRDREVTLNTPYSPVETSTLSPLVAELGSQLTKHVSVDTGLQWDPDINEFVRGKAVVHFINEPGQIINLGYLYRKNPQVPNQTNDITQSDMSFRWPIYDNWYAVGRWQYSWLYNATQDGFFGLEKENCCWRFRIIGRQYLNSLVKNSNTIGQTSDLTVDGTSQTGVFFQIELKGLTGVGEKLDDFFEHSIYGYRKPE